MISRHLAIPLLLAITACTNEAPSSSTHRGGTVVIATAGVVGSLFPPLVSSTTGRQVTELVYDYLTEVSPALNTIDDKSFAPRLAKSWDWSSDSMSLAVHLQPEAKWHDGQPVRADDVLYSYGVYSDTSFSSMASQLARIDSATARDSLTVVFWFNQRYPLQFYDATSQMQILPKHILGRIPTDSLSDAVTSIKPVGTGRYRFVSANDESIELAADTTNYRGAPKISRVIWRAFGTGDQAARALLAGDVDIYDAMTRVHVAESAGDSNVKVVMSPGADYAFMAFNFTRPLFASRDLRRALTMGVDRSAMVRNVFDSIALPGIGPTVRYFPSTDSGLRQIPYDPEGARRILDSLGWRVDPKTGMRRRNEQALRFSAILPSTSSNRVKMGTLIQEQLRKIGVAVNLDQMEFGTFNARFYGHDFDAALASWHLGTSPASIRQIWTSEAAKDGNNLGAYASSTFDAYVDSAVSTFDAEKSKAYYTRAYQTAIDDAPAIWLYEPRLVLALHKRIHTVPYRPDAWWWSLADWYIPENERLPRDGMK